MMMVVFFEGSGALQGLSLAAAHNEQSIDIEYQVLSLWANDDFLFDLTSQDPSAKGVHFSPGRLPLYARELH
jgi:hypothetical protein